MRLRVILVSFFLFLIPFSLFFPAREFSFQFDDALFLTDDNVRLGRWPAFIWPPESRLLSWLSLLIQYRTHGPHSGPFHLFNIVLHAFNTILVFLLLFCLLSDSAVQGRQRLLPAAFGALVFALHPLQTESVLYIYQRSTLLAAFFSFLTLLLHRMERPKLALACLLLALFSKEFAAAVPVVLWLHDGLLRSRWKPRRSVVAGLIFTAAVTILWLFSVPGRSGLDWQAGLRYAATQVRALWFYQGLTLSPHSLNVDWDFQPQRNLDFQWWLALLGLSLLVLVLVRGRKRFPLACFFGVIYFVFLLPTSSLIPRADYVFEHRVYASLLGFAGLLSLGVCVAASVSWGRRLSTPSGSFRLWTTAVLCALLLITYSRIDAGRLRDWQDERTLWQSAVQLSPDKFRPNYNYGVALMESAPETALHYLSRAVQISPNVSLAHASLGEVYRRLDRLEEAEQRWKRALEIAPDDAEVNLALGELFAQKRDYVAARRYLTQAQQLDARDWRTYFQLAQLNMLFGFTDQVRIQSELGLGLNPDHAGLRLLLADAMAQSGNWKRALELYDELIRRDPGQNLYYLRQASALRALQGDTP